ncbi:GNAT family N-acetyltransferase [Acidaminobacter sp. JC074]|uniref:GNAT family N-acetyltransferase n=1 Tax=Acidaminobacter sp. JC074 TaxID=2530199 RepID=UPI001F111C3C|nr:GNAT family N-acetyltransferase [Acidaminobacter sp. JC074]MCH4889464.1 GNAT family N-acetyltransferase [Acidaminobacter sp. JC074]
MHLLDKSNYKNIIDLIDPSCLSLQLKTVIENKNPGFIYVDKKTKPQSGLIYHQGEGGFFFIGKASQSFFDEVRRSLKSISETHLNGDLQEFEFSFDSKAWEDQIDLKDMSTCQQYIYHSQSSELIAELDFDDIEIIGISESSFKYENASFIESPTKSWWGDINVYLKEDLGFVALKDNKIIGRCLLDGKVGNYMGIGIAVEENYRKKSIASALAIKMVNAIHRLGYKVYWECTDNNYGSMALTKKCHLKKIQAYNLYWFEV